MSVFSMSASNNVSSKDFKHVATTPQAMTAAIQSFCSSLSPEPPVFLDLQSYDFAVMGMCYVNAAKLAERLGGHVVFGWLVWELHGAFACSEHHAVCEVGGELVDCSPPHAGERRVLFVPDHAFQSSFDSHPNLPCQYGPLESHPLIEKYCDIARRKAELSVAAISLKRPMREIITEAEYRRLDDKMCALLDRYFAEREKQSEHQRHKIARQKKMEQRQRKKQVRQRKKQGRR